MCSLCSSAPYRILLVDDEPAIRRTLRRFLERQGCKVEEAEDGRHARKRLLDDPFDAVVSDLDMSPEDGVALWSWVTAQRPELRSRVLIFSARPVPPALAAQQVAYVPKPSPLAEVWAALRSMLERPPA